MNISPKVQDRLERLARLDGETTFHILFTGNMHPKRIKYNLFSKRKFVDPYGKECLEWLSVMPIKDGARVEDFNEMLNQLRDERERS